VTHSITIVRDSHQLETHPVVRDSYHSETHTSILWRISLQDCHYSSSWIVSIRDSYSRVLMSTLCDNNFNASFKAFQGQKRKCLIQSSSGPEKKAQLKKKRVISISFKYIISIYHSKLFGAVNRIANRPWLKSGLAHVDRLKWILSHHDSFAWDAVEMLTSHFNVDWLIRITQKWIVLASWLIHMESCGSSHCVSHLEIISFDCWG